MPEPAAQPKRRPWAAIAAAGVLVLPLGSIYAFSVFLKPLESLLGASRSELATVFGIAAICYTIGMNVGPRLFRRISLSLLLALAALINAGGSALSGAATSFAELALGYGVLSGLAGGLSFVAVQQGVNLMGMRRSGLVNGFLVSLLPLGAMLATPLFGWGIAVFGVRETLYALAALFLASGLLAIALARLAGMRLAADQAADLGRAQRPDGGSTPVSREAAPASDRGAAPDSTGRVLVFWKLFCVFFLAAAAGLMVLSQAAGIVAAYGGATALAYLATTGLTGGIALARIGGGWLVDRLSIPSVMAGAQAAALAGAVLLTLWPSPDVSILALLTIGMGYGVISGATAGAVACYWPRAHYGRVAGRVYIAWCAAAVTLPVLAAHLFDVTGGYATAFLIAGAGNLVAALVALTLPRQATA